MKKDIDKIVYKLLCDHFGETPNYDSLKQTTEHMFELIDKYRELEKVDITEIIDFETGIVDIEKINKIRHITLSERDNILYMMLKYIALNKDKINHNKEPIKFGVVENNQFSEDDIKGCVFLGHEKADESSSDSFDRECDKILSRFKYKPPFMLRMLKRFPTVKSIININESRHKIDVWENLNKDDRKMLTGYSVRESALNAMEIGKRKNATRKNNIKA